MVNDESQLLLSLPVAMAREVAELEPEFTRRGGFATCDPVGSQLGSGGGAAHLLVEAWRNAGEPQPFTDWLRQSRKLLIHAGGQSRRLPAYATVGKAFISAYGFLLVYMIGHLIFMFGVAFRPAVLSMGHPDRILVIYFLASSVYFAALIYLLKSFGVMGAAIAQVAFHALWFVGMGASILQFARLELRGAPA